MGGRVRNFGHQIFDTVLCVYIYRGVVSISGFGIFEVEFLAFACAS